MTWSDGIPSKTRPFRWPQPETEQFRKKSLSTLRRLAGVSVYDDFMAHFVSYFPKDGNQETAIYLGDIREENDAVVIEQVAVLPLYLLSVQLLPRESLIGAVYASVEFRSSASQVVLRIHARDGSTVKEKSVPAKAPYGKLVVHKNMLAICIGSGEEPEKDPEYFYNDTVNFYRMDYILDVELDEDSDALDPPVPDTIVCWDYIRDLVYVAKVPQSDALLMQHSGNFEFVAPDRVALAGAMYSSGADFTAPLLKSFSIDDPSSFHQTIIPTTDALEDDHILRFVSVSGSSEASSILIHHYDSRRRVTILHKDILAGKVELEQHEGKLINVIDFSMHQRNMGACLSTRHLPSVSGNRAIAQENQDCYPQPLPLLILDFSKVHTTDGLFKFIASKAVLPVDVDVENIAITSSALVEAGPPYPCEGYNKGWRVFDFDN